MSHNGPQLIEHELARTLNDIISYLKENTKYLVRWEVAKLKCYQDYEQYIEDNNIYYSDKISRDRLPKQSIFEKYKNLIKKYPDNIELLSASMEFNLECHHYREALSLQNKIINLSPISKNYLSRAKIYFKSIIQPAGNEPIKEAENLGFKDVNKAIDLEPKEYASYEERGNFNEHKKDFEAAIKDYDKAITLLNDGYTKSSIIVKIGEIYSKQLQQYEKAIKIFTSAIKISNYSDSFLLRAEAYYSNRQYNKAIKDLLKFNGKNKGNDRSYALLAQCYGKIEDYENVIKNYKLANDFLVEIGEWAEYQEDVEYAYEQLVGKLKNKEINKNPENLDLINQFLSISTEKQKFLVREYNKKLQVQKKQIEEIQFETVGRVAHNLNKQIGKIKTDFKTILLYLEDKNINLNEDKSINNDPESENISKVISRQLNHFEDITKTVERTLKIGRMKKENFIFEEVYLKQYLKDIININFSNPTNYKINILPEKGNGPRCKIDKENFKGVFINLIDNAIIHGFNDSKNFYNIEFDIYTNPEKNKVIIDVKNDGKPLPKSFNIKKFSQWGVAYGNKQGSGIGGVDICQTILLHGGKIKNVETEIGVHFKITLPKKQDETEIGGL